jgi:hypothetical protein
MNLHPKTLERAVQAAIDAPTTTPKGGDIMLMPIMLPHYFVNAALDGIPAGKDFNLFEYALLDILLSFNKYKNPIEVAPVDRNIIIFDADSYHIATVKGIISLMTDRNDVLAPAANAALIAAAPEMLDIALRARDYIQEDIANYAENGTYKYICCIIAKAEGNYARR